MEAFTSSFPRSLEACREDCLAWLRDHEAEEAAPSASLLTSRAVSLALVAPLAGGDVLDSCCLALEHRGLSREELLPVGAPSSRATRFDPPSPCALFIRVIFVCCGQYRFLFRPHMAAPIDDFHTSSPSFKKPTKIAFTPPYPVTAGH